MKRTLLFLALSASLSFALKAQETEHKTVINQEMISRFNACETSGEYLSWRDLVLGFENQTLNDFFYAYMNADMNNQTLSEIKTNLEKQIQEHLNSNISEHDLARYNQIKREINSKLVLSEVAALE